MPRKVLTKHLLFFLIGSTINILMFSITKYTPFPLWLDYTGSFLITALAGPMAGCISAFIHTLILLSLIDGYAALLPLIPMLTVCIILWYTIKAVQEYDVSGLISGSSIAVIVAFILNGFIILCLPQMYGKYAAYENVLSVLRKDFGIFFGSFILSAAITLPELVLSLTILWIVYFIIPKKTDKLTFKK